MKERRWKDLWEILHIQMHIWMNKLKRASIILIHQMLWMYLCAYVRMIYYWCSIFSLMEIQCESQLCILFYILFLRSTQNLWINFRLPLIWKKPKAFFWLSYHWSESHSAMQDHSIFFLLLIHWHSTKKIKNFCCCTFSTAM